MTTWPALPRSFRPDTPPTPTTAEPRATPIHLMDARVIMQVVVHAVAPGIRPAISLEQVFEQCRRIDPLRQPHSRAIMDQGPRWMIGDKTRLLESILLWRALTNSAL